ncbi:MAG: hypothetical protein OXC30_01360 [Alphaproteobacteria bacterium]|nr:hypothetical protein [Alphaproteobacteria bacterium]
MPLLLLFIICLQAYGSEGACDDDGDPCEDIVKFFAQKRISCLSEFDEGCRDFRSFAKLKMSLDEWMTFAKPVLTIVDAAYKRQHPNLSEEMFAKKREDIIQLAKQGFFPLSIEKFCLFFHELKVEFKRDLQDLRDLQLLHQTLLREKELGHLIDFINIPQERAKIENKNIHLFFSLLESLYHFCRKSKTGANSAYWLQLGTWESNQRKFDPYRSKILRIFDPKTTDVLEVLKKRGFCFSRCTLYPQSFVQPKMSMNEWMTFAQPIVEILLSAYRKMYRGSAAEISQQSLLIAQSAKQGFFRLDLETYFLSLHQLKIDYEKDFLQEERATLEDVHIHSLRSLLESLYAFCLHQKVGAEESYSACWKKPIQRKEARMHAAVLV